ncbi:MAG: TrmH family RNA methyltransferase [Anaerolineaceae bacterium]
MISSTANEQIKAIRKLRERKNRVETNTFYIEGIRIVREAIAKPERIKTIIVAPDLLKSISAEDALVEVTQLGVPILEVNQTVFESFSLKDNPQGLAAVVKQDWGNLDEINYEEMGLWVGLDSIADPGNLGTIMRTLDAVGGKGLFLIDACTDPFDPTAVRGSMGAIFTMELIKVTSPELIRWKKENNIFAYGTSDSAKINYQEIEYPRNMILMMGSERQGLHQDLMRCCDAMVGIPMAGKSDSLNLAVATGITLYEIFNQQKKKEAA